MCSREGRTILIPLRGYAMEARVRELQRTLYRAARAQRARRFYSLRDKVYRPDVLREAWRRVKVNGGAPGVDGVTIETIEARGIEPFLEGLREALRTGTYRCRPVRRVMIPKPKGGQRPLGIPTVRDRVVQTAVRLVIEPLFEADFQDCSYGYRPKRSAVHASLEVYKWLNYGLVHVVDVDLECYFDRIPHERLLHVLQRRIADGYILRLIRAWLRAGVLYGHKFHRSAEGTPQGATLSPLLGNCYLNELDRWWIQEGMTRRAGWNAQLVRYADDLRILTDKRPEPIAQKLHQRLEALGLPVNREKSCTLHAKDGFAFLGFMYRRGYAPRYQKVVTHFFVEPEAIKRVIRKLTQITNRQRSHEAIGTIVAEMNQNLLGWSEYYRHTASSRRFRKVQGHACRRLRRFILAKHGKRHRSGIWGLSEKVLHERYGLVDIGTNRVQYRWT
jgi:RNA-directed DNA polymerase